MEGSEVRRPRKVTVLVGSPHKGGATFTDKALEAQSRRFHEQLLRPARPVPSLFGLMMFRMGRTGIKLGVGEEQRDHTYYRDQGWFESDYY